MEDQGLYDLECSVCGKVFGRTDEQGLSEKYQLLCTTCGEVPDEEEDEDEVEPEEKEKE